MSIKLWIFNCFISQHKELKCILNSPCKNNAKCTDQDDGSYICACENGYKGDNCEIGETALVTVIIRGKIFNYTFQ